MDINEPGSSGETTAATTTQRPTDTKIDQATDTATDKAAGKSADKATDKPADKATDKPATRNTREAHGRGVRQTAGIEQAREVGASSESQPVYGSGERPRRLLLIGLDGATPELALGAWRTELRTLHMLTDRGTRARVRSSVPWSSTPAWQSLLSGQDPGQLGIYGSARRLSHSYAAPVALDSRALREPRLWDLLGTAGKLIGVVGAPATTPAPQVAGHLIGDRVVDGQMATYPAALRQQVALWLADDAPLQLAMEDDLDLVVGSAYVRSEQRFRLARRLLSRNTYDCFVIYDDGIATVQRALWDSLDVTHQRYTPDHSSAGAISAFYRFVDEQIGELLELIDDDTIVAVVSACGTQALDGELALNDWLIAQGELVLNALPSERSALADCDVAWDRTRAWAGEDGGIYLNVAGREPQGIVPADQIEQVCASLAERLRALVVPELAGGASDTATSVEVYRPSALYSAVRGIAPELIAICTRSGWRTSALVGRGAAWVSTMDTPMDAACESSHGLVVLYDPRNFGGGRELDELSVYDIMPTLLALLDQPSPARLRGRAVID